MQSFIRTKRKEIENILELYKNDEKRRNDFNELEKISLSYLFEEPISAIESYAKKWIEYKISLKCQRGLSKLSKNRYKDVLPLDKHIPLENTYINASVIGTVYPHQDYIVTQYPLSSTKIDFWEMLWNLKDCSIIVNLVPAKETLFKDIYYPLQIFHVERYGSFFVEKIEEKQIEDIISIYTVKLYENTCECIDFKIINIVHFLKWEDKNIPSSPFDLIKLIDVVNDLNPKRTNPIVVHCTAGIGRSGVFIIVHKILTRLRGIISQKYDKDWLDDCVKDEILEIRKYRPGMIQTSSQFSFCYVPIIIQLTKYETLFEKMDMYIFFLFFSYCLM